MDLSRWDQLIHSLWDEGNASPGHSGLFFLPGANLWEWHNLAMWDYDAIDREFYLETIGGG